MTSEQCRYKKIIFVTTNENKIREVKNGLNSSGINCDDLIISLPIEIDEIQGNSKEVASYKCLSAYDKIKSLPEFQQYKTGELMVLTEDTSLEFNAWEGLPGPFIKYFLQKLKVEGMSTLLTGFTDKSAKAMTIMGCMDGTEESEPKLIIGETFGKIVEPRGSRSFGWDAAFEEDTTGKTYGEMEIDEKQKVSHRGKAVRLLLQFLNSN